MQAPDAQRLRDALDALKNGDADRAAEVLEDLLAHAPARALGHDEIAEDSSLEQKSWFCVQLASTRIGQDRLTNARVMLYSAIDHAEDNLEPGTTVDEGGGLLG